MAGSSTTATIRSPRKIAGGDETIVGRVTTTVWNQNNGPGILELSAALGTTQVSDESALPNGLRGRTVMSQFDFYEPVFVKGRRTRFEADVDWMRGPFSTRAEYTWMSDDRHEQGFGSDDLPQARARGFYVSGTAVVTGERKNRPVEPRHWFGAIEAAGRFDRLRFGGVPGDDMPFRNPRAVTIYPVANEVTTVGVNWYVNRFAKIQVNAIREKIDDAERSPVPNGAAFWSRSCGCNSCSRTSAWRPSCVADWLLRALCRCCCGPRGSSPAQPVPDPSDPFFDDTVLHEIRLAINSKDWHTLKSNYLANDYYPCDFKWGSHIVRNVGIRSRGTGSRSGVKPGLRVDFDRYTSNQKFLGLKSFVLRNNTQDQSNMHERLSMLFFRTDGRDGDLARSPRQALCERGVCRSLHDRRIGGQDVSGEALHER